MAPPGDKSPDDADQNIKFKCCSTKNLTTKICINCGGGFHSSCSVRNNITEFDSTRLICCDDVNLTSKAKLLGINLSKELLITNLLDVIEKLQTKVTRNEAALQKLRGNQERTKQARCNSDSSDSLSSVALLRENELLQKLNQELDDKNSLLKCRINDLEEKMKVPSYANALKQNYNQRPSNIISIPNILIMPKKQENLEDTKNKIKNNICPHALKIGINNIHKLGKSIAIKCNNINSVNILKNELDAKMKEYTISVQTLKKPRLKMIGIEQEITPNELTKTIISLNIPGAKPEDLRVCHIQKSKKDNTHTAYIETTPAIKTKLLQTKKVLIDWQRCPVYEDWNITRCFKCNGYNHSAKNCKNKEACYYCAEEHDSRDCKNKNSSECINCQKSNMLYHTSYETSHKANEETKCGAFQRLLARRKAETMSI